MQRSDRLNIDANLVGLDAESLAKLRREDLSEFRGIAG
jgi:hypothetical protein